LTDVTAAAKARAGEAPRLPRPRLDQMLEELAVRNRWFRHV